MRRDFGHARRVIAYVVGVAALSTLVASDWQAQPAQPTAVTPLRTVPTRDEAVAQASQVIAARPELVGASPEEAHPLVNVTVDQDGRTHVRYDRTYRGLPVLGGDFVVHHSPGGHLDTVSGARSAPIAVSTTPTVPAAKAAATAVVQLSRPEAVAEDPELVVDARPQSPRLAWRTKVNGPVHGLLVVTDAQTDEVLSTAEIGTAQRRSDTAALAPAVGTGRGVYTGSQPVQLNISQNPDGSFTLRDEQHDGSWTCDYQRADNDSATCRLFTSADPEFGDGTTLNDESVAVDAHYALGQTADYFAAKHGRSSLITDRTTGAPQSVQVGVHFDVNLENAEWVLSSNKILVGDGEDGRTPFAELDVMGHELTHGVEESILPTLQMRYGEPRAVMEFTSDIFGEMVQFHANNPEQPADYLLAQRTSAQRSMSNPSQDGHTKNCWDGPPPPYSENVYDWVGIGDRFFYMLAEGSGPTRFNQSPPPPCGNAPGVTGIGRDKAAKIWYQTFNYMTATITFAGARQASLNAARDLHGLCSAEYRAVQASWTAVNVQGTDPACHVNPSSDLNTMWNNYGNAGGHWTGGDGTVSVRLPDGRTAWLFSDTFLGTVNADFTRPTSTPFVRNSMVVQQGNALTETRTGGTPAQPVSLVEQPDSGEHYWIGDAVVEGGSIRALYNTYRTTGSGGLDFQLTGTSLATFDANTLQRTGLQRLPTGATTAWGSALLEDKDYTYVYGTESAGGMKFGKVARAARGNVGGTWQFWTGSQWSGDESAGARLLSGVGTNFAVERVDDRYVLITQDTNIPFSRSFVAHVADSPTGPFGESIYLFDSDVQYPGKPIIYYDAHVHRELSPAGRLVVSYNVNSLNAADNYADARIYRPRFVDVSVPLPGPCTVGAPQAPTNLAATNNADGTVGLTWTPPSGSGLKYRIYQRDVTAGQTHFARQEQTLTTPATTVPFLKNGSTYEFRVSAVNGTCEGPQTPTKSHTVQVPAPRPPVNLRATAGLDGDVKLEWGASPDVVTYAVYKRDVTGQQPGFEPVDHPQPLNTTLTVRNLEHNHVYEFRVTAKHGGGESAPSNVVTATAKHRPPGAPTNLTASIGWDGTILLRWTPPPSDEPLWYWVYQRDVTAGETTFTQLPYPITSGPEFRAGLLIDNHVYEFYVTAINSVTTGPPSNTVRATVWMPPPPPPTGLRATPGDGEVRLNWTAPPGDDVWYWIYQKDVSAGDTSFSRLPYPLTDGGTSFTAGLLANGHEYHFYVTSISNGGESAPSNVVSATPRPPKPAAPGLTVTANGDSTVTLKWTEPEPDLLYWIYQRDVTAGQTSFTRLQYPSNGTSFLASLTVRHIYEFRVSAVNAGGEGPQSATARVTTRVDAPTNLAITVSDGGHAHLSWKGPNPDLFYWIYQRDVTAGQTQYTKLQYPVEGTSFTASLLINAHVYDFYVTTSAGGGDSGPSNVVRITARGGKPPAAPTLTARAGDSKVTLSWNDTGDFYWIYKRCITCGEANYTKYEWPTQSLSFVDTGVLNAFVYEYRVAANNANGDSPMSNAVRAKPLPPLPGAPTNMRAVPGDGKVTLSWTAPGPDLMYWIYQRDVTAGQTSFTRSKYPVTVTNWTVSWLMNSHRYEFYTEAVNGAGAGPRSAIVSATPMPPKPTAPGNLGYSWTGSNSIRLTWGASTPSNVFYWIYMRDVTAGESFRRLYYPTTNRSVEIGLLRGGHRYEFFVTADNLAGESGQSNHVFANPGPQVGAVRCASVASSWRGMPEGEPAVQYDYPFSQMCGTRRGDYFDVRWYWTTLGHHLYFGSFIYQLWDCTTGTMVWQKRRDYPDNPSLTEEGSTEPVYVNSTHTYRVRVVGYGQVQGEGQLNLRFSPMPAPGVTPFDKYGECF
ncbi:fibronectin type III domain-containing protein [Kibdelosporangium aridum]|nr:fibronectin type III domain-containing protein [Kibdelosporangium aridum]